MRAVAGSESVHGGFRHPLITLGGSVIHASAVLTFSRLDARLGLASRVRRGSRYRLGNKGALRNLGFVVVLRRATLADG